MIRPALAFATALAAATPALASTYSATLSAPVSGRFITRDIRWSCGPDACLGSTDESRPEVLCQSLAKRAGEVEGFIADGRAFTTAELGRCNAVASHKPPRSLAAQ